MIIFERSRLFLQRDRVEFSIERDNLIGRRLSNLVSEYGAPSIWSKKALLLLGRGMSTRECQARKSGVVQVDGGLEILNLTYVVLFSAIPR
ncbi:MAG: hypothetical protein JWQ43_1150, partial [Glaciihabitans sp.]|nr:hypothetical protein [Glaciihabitans sp.]